MSDTHHADSKDDPKNPTKTPLQLSEYYERDFIGSKDELRGKINVLAYEVTDSDDVVKQIADLLVPFITAEVRKAEDALLDRLEGHVAEISALDMERYEYANNGEPMMVIPYMAVATLKAERNGRSDA